MKRKKKILLFGVVLTTFLMCMMPAINIVEAKNYKVKNEKIISDIGKIDLVKEKLSTLVNSPTQLVSLEDLEAADGGPIFLLFFGIGFILTAIGSVLIIYCGFIGQIIGLPLFLLGVAILQALGEEVPDMP